jgi:hypothetical protein
MPTETGDNDKSGTTLNRAQRRHLFQSWYKKTPKLFDPVWKAKTRKARKARKKFIKKQRKINK